MTSSVAQELLRDALMLPVDQRAAVATELLASRDDPHAEDEAVVRTAWAREIEARARRVMAGESKANSGRKFEMRFPGVSPGIEPSVLRDASRFRAAPAGHRPGHSLC